MSDDGGVKSSLNFDSEDVRSTIKKAAEPIWCRIYQNGLLPSRNYFEKNALTNDVHLKAFLEFRGNSLGELYKFSKRTALNCCLDDVKGKYSEGLRCSDPINEETFDEKSKERIVELDEILNQLNVRDSIAYKCVFLFYFEGHSADEICKILDIDNNQFNYNKRQALKFLRNKF